MHFNGMKAQRDEMTWLRTYSSYLAVPRLESMPWDSVACAFSVISPEFFLISEVDVCVGTGVSNLAISWQQTGCILLQKLVLRGGAERGVELSKAPWSQASLWKVPVF